MESLKIYHVDKDYINFLRRFDRKVTIVKQDRKARPYVGIVFEINGFNYFAPLSSPEKDDKGELTERYKQYFNKNNKPTYEKIEDLKYGTININNMIPVPNSQLIYFDIENIEDENYKNILQDEFFYCNNNKKRILDKADKLYKLVTIKKTYHFVNLSCNFKLLEEKCLEYQELIEKQTAFNKENSNEVIINIKPKEIEGQPPEVAYGIINKEIVEEVEVENTITKIT